MPPDDRRRVPPGLHAVAGGLGHGQAHGGLADEPRQQADGVRAAADAGEREVRQPALDGPQLGRRLVADPPLEVPDDRRVRVRAHRGAQDVVRGLDVRDPVAHRLVDGVLERRGAGGDGPDLRAQRPHAEHVRGLAADVLLAHEHDAREAEQGARGGGGDAVLAGAGLRDDPGLAEPAGEQRLAERVVDLVGAGVGQVLALEVEPEAGGMARPTAGRDGRRRAPPPPPGHPRAPASSPTAAARRSARYSDVGRPANRASRSSSSAQNRGSWRIAS